MFILLTNTIRDGTAEFKCLRGYKATEDNEELVKEFSETTCKNEDACFSAKGSFVINGNTCELLNFIYKKKF